MWDLISMVAAQRWLTVTAENLWSIMHSCRADLFDIIMYPTLTAPFAQNSLCRQLHKCCLSSVTTSDAHCGDFEQQIR